MIFKTANVRILPHSVKTNILDQDDPEILATFKKTAADLRAIAPKAKDFLYFTAIMMHAAEASLIDDDGEIKKHADGSPITSSWDTEGNTWKWKCSDTSIKPYKNSNCLVPGTDILMSDGSSKSIEDIVVGDEVFTHKGRVKKVKATFCHDINAPIFTIKTTNATLNITSEHPVFVNNSWIEAKNLKIGNNLTSFDSDFNYVFDEIKEFNSIDYTGKVYNFEVEDDNSYIANGVVVHNSDIFPELELKKAYKNWVSKPLCLDHQSNSVDHIRGIIVDTAWDNKYKRIIALCALDKVNYPDLARKVETGYSNSVSMGVGVERAICTEHGCHKVATNESEFCPHMISKSGYGEINVGLNPIELSLVVNPADQRAKIRQVIASADRFFKHVNASDNSFTHDEFKDIKTKVITLKEQMEIAADMIEEIERELSESGNNESLDHESPYGAPRESKVEMDQTELPGTDQNLSTPIRFAQDKQQLQEKIAKLNNFINKMNYVEERKILKREDFNMAQSKKSYHLGGGGVNDPANLPYDKEDYTTIRDKQDKQMVGQAPFPEMGGQSGSFPGDEAKKKELHRAASKTRRQAIFAKAKDAIRQKKEAYHLGGGDDKDYPASVRPPKQPYKVEDYKSIRDKQDKQMVGAKPFPSVGPVDGFYPGDLETKKKLSRASKLVARFVKASRDDGTVDVKNSRWDVFAKHESGPKLVLSATVGEMAGDKADVLYAGIATKDYGSKIIETIRATDIETAKSIFKGAQAMPAAQPAAPAIPAMPQAPAAPAPMPAGDMGDFGFGAPEAGVEAGPEADYAGEGGEPIEQIQNIVQDIDNNVAELMKLVETLRTENDTDLANVPAAPIDEAAVPPQAGLNTTARVRALTKMRKTLNLAIRKGASKTIKELSDAREELDLIREVVSRGVKISDVSWLNKITKKAFEEAISQLNDSKTLKESYSAYRQGTRNLVKKAAKVRAMIKKAQLSEELLLVDEACEEVNSSQISDEAKKALCAQVRAGAFNSKQDPAMVDAQALRAAINRAKTASRKGGLSKKAIIGEEAWLQQNPGKTRDDYIKYVMQTADVKGLGMSAPKFDGPAGVELDWTPGAGKAERAPDASDEPLARTPRSPKKDYLERRRESIGLKRTLDDNDLNTDEAKMGIDEIEKGVDKVEKNLSTEASLAKLRLKVAKKAGEFASILDQAHAGDTKVDVGASGDLASIETLESTHSKMMATMGQNPKVRKDAEAINKLVIAGDINPAKDFPGLIAQGLDSSAVSYWKKFYGDSKDGGSEFAAALVKDNATKKAAEEISSYKVKIARAWELVDDMVSKGIVQNSRKAKQEEVEKLVTFSDEQFDQLKKMASKYPSVNKTVMPTMGMQESIISSASVIVPNEVSTDLKSEFDAAFRATDKIRRPKF